MGYSMKQEAMNNLIDQWRKDYIIYAPKRFPGGHTFSDKDRIRYGQVHSFDEIEFHEKAEYSFKEILLPLSQTLFFFTEDEMKEPQQDEKEAIIFLRSCDMHAVKRLDEIYLKNGFEDHYYRKLREKVKFILMGCEHSFENCFCVSMGTNQTEDYDCSIDVKGDAVLINNRCVQWESLFQGCGGEVCEVWPCSVNENQVKVQIPDNLSPKVAQAKMWDEYDSRCISCGRCNFVCPTCTCFTMQDVFYTDNGKVGERRRVHASCMVDGYTDVAGGGNYRKKNGQRMRFRVLHKIYDYKKRFQYHMCIGCGRCDDICPEYISFTNCINNLQNAMEEVGTDEK